MSANWAIRARMSADAVDGHLNGDEFRVPESEVREILASDASQVDGALDEEVAIWAAGHPHCPPDFITDFLADRLVLSGGRNARITIHEAIASNDSLGGNVLRAAWMDAKQYPESASMYASNRTLPADVLSELVDMFAGVPWESSGGSHYILSRNPSVPVDAGQRLLASAFKLLAEEDGKPSEGSLSPSIVGFILSAYEREHSRAWFTSEMESQALVLAAID